MYSVNMFFRIFAIFFIIVAFFRLKNAIYYKYGGKAYDNI